MRLCRTHLRLAKEEDLLFLQEEDLLLAKEEDLLLLQEEDLLLAEKEDLLLLQDEDGCGKAAPMTSQGREGKTFQRVLSLKK